MINSPSCRYLDNSRVAEGFLVAVHKDRIERWGSDSMINSLISRDLDDSHVAEGFLVAVHKDGWVGPIAVNVDVQRLVRLHLQRAKLGLLTVPGQIWSTHRGRGTRVQLARYFEPRQGQKDCIRAEKLQSHLQIILHTSHLNTQFFEIYS